MISLSEEWELVSLRYWACQFILVSTSTGLYIIFAIFIAILSDGGNNLVARNGSMQLN